MKFVFQHQKTDVVDKIQSVDTVSDNSTRRQSGTLTGPVQSNARKRFVKKKAPSQGFDFASNTLHHLVKHISCSCRFF